MVDDILISILGDVTERSCRYSPSGPYVGVLGQVICVVRRQLLQGPVAHSVGVRSHHEVSCQVCSTQGRERLLRRKEGRGAYNHRMMSLYTMVRLLTLSKTLNK